MKKKRYKKARMNDDMFSESSMNKEVFAEARRKGKKLWVEKDEQGNIVESVWYEVVGNDLVYGYRAWKEDGAKVDLIETFKRIKENEDVDLFISGKARGTKYKRLWKEKGMNELGDFLYV